MTRSTPPIPDLTTATGIETHIAEKQKEREALIESQRMVQQIGIEGWIYQEEHQRAMNWIESRIIQCDISIRDHQKLLDAMPKKHFLKCQTVFFNSILSGEKTFELRKNDRNFSVGDILVLEDFDMHKQEYKGRQIVKQITYMLESMPEFGLMAGYCILGIKDVEAGK